MMAEINTFHQTKAQDIKHAHQKFLQEQIAFYQKVIFFGEKNHCIVVSIDLIRAQISCFHTMEYINSI